MLGAIFQRERLNDKAEALQKYGISFSGSRYSCALIYDVIQNFTEEVAVNWVFTPKYVTMYDKLWSMALKEAE